ncbi:MAG: alanine--glyoxylate aminotransferase family protein [Nevskia sp.]
MSTMPTMTPKTSPTFPAAPPAPLAAFVAPRRVLMGPGPSDVHARVLAAMGQGTIGHLDPEFVRLMDEIKLLLRGAFRTENDLTFAISAPGSIGMETSVVNLVEPGDTIVVCVNGVFGGRICSMAERAGATVVKVATPWGRAVDLDAAEAALKANPGARVLAFVQAETSTGALSDARALAALARQYGALSLCDTVTSLAGVPLEVDAWGLDAVYSATQKCLSAPPGLSPVTFSARAVERLKTRRTPVVSWFQDLALVMSYWGSGGHATARRTYHHTAPVNALFGLHEALRMLHEEGLEASWARHARLHRLLVEGFERLGIRMVVPEGERLPQLNAIWIPEGVDDAAARGRLLNEFGLEIGAGLGDFAGKVWRIGLMGQSCSERHVELGLKAIAAVCKR